MLGAGVALTLRFRHIRWKMPLDWIGGGRGYLRAVHPV